MKELEVNKPDPAPVVQQVHNSKLRGHILPSPGHKVWCVNKKTDEVTEVQIKRSHVTTRKDINTTEIHHKVEGFPEFFYTSALNKKNALRHWHKSNEYKYLKLVASLPKRK